MKIWFVSLKMDFQSALRTLSTPMFINKKTHSIECESMLFVTDHIPNLWGLSNSFSNSFIDFFSCEVVSSRAIRKNQVQSFFGFASIMAVVLKLWIYFISEVLHEVKQKLKQLSRMRSSDWKLLLNTLQRLTNRTECTSHDVCASRKMSTHAF